MGAIFYSLLGILSGNFKFPVIFWTKNSVLKKLPELNPENLAGGILIWDHTTDDRALVQATIDSAHPTTSSCVRLTIRRTLIGVVVLGCAGVAIAVVQEHASAL